MSQTTAPADRIRRAAIKWANAIAREAAVLAAQAASEDPDSQHHLLAIDRAVGSKLAARSALIRAVPAIPSMIDLGDVLVVVSPGEQADAPRPGRRWDPEQLQVLALPRSAVLA